MRAACLQLRVDLCQREGNTTRAIEMADLATARGADILVFPEMFITGFCYDQSMEEKPYPSLDPFRAFVRDRDCLIIGSIMGGKYNLGFCLGPEGIQFQPKIHPFDQEKLHFSGGGCISPLNTKWGKVGLEICYDLRFPEVARSLAMQGADFLVTIGQFPAARRAHWRILCLARAIENQLPHLACNWANGGGSLIIDARGQVQAEAGQNEEAIFGEIDLVERDKWRKEIFYLGERRPELY
ncbi:Nitrilase [uncultured archaeon]|nr:Nitrilase [uncultured archaeon]